MISYVLVVLAVFRRAEYSSFRIQVRRPRAPVGLHAVEQMVRASAARVLGRVPCASDRSPRHAPHFLGRGRSHGRAQGAPGWWRARRGLSPQNHRRGSRPPSPQGLVARSSLGGGCELAGQLHALEDAILAGNLGHGILRRERGRWRGRVGRARAGQRRVLCDLVLPLGLLPVRLCVLCVPPAHIPHALLRARLLQPGEEVHRMAAAQHITTIVAGAAHPSRRLGRPPGALIPGLSLLSAHESR